MHLFVITANFRKKKITAIWFGTNFWIIYDRRCNIQRKVLSTNRYARSMHDNAW